MLCLKDSRVLNPRTQDVEGIMEWFLNADSDKLIAQTYNSEAVMSGENGRLQATIKQPNHMRILCTAVYINYIYVRCCAHKLYLIMAKLSPPQDWPCWTVFLNRSLEYEVLVAILKTNWLIQFIKIKTLPKEGLKSFKLTGSSQMCKKRQDFLRWATTSTFGRYFSITLCLKSIFLCPARAS